MSKNPLHMWKYWSEKHGVQEALVSYYPEIVATEPALGHALAQLVCAELAINAKMKELEEEEQDG